MNKVNIKALKKMLEKNGFKTTLFDDANHDKYKDVICQTVFESDVEPKISLIPIIENSGFTFDGNHWIGEDPSYQEIQHKLYIFSDANTHVYIQTEIEINGMA